MKYIQIETIELVECPELDTKVGIRFCKACEFNRVGNWSKEIGCMYGKYEREDKT